MLKASSRGYRLTPQKKINKEYKMKVERRKMKKEIREWIELENVKTLGDKRNNNDLMEWHGLVFTAHLVNGNN